MGIRRNFISNGIRHASFWRLVNFLILGKDNEIITKIIKEKHIFPKNIDVSNPCKTLINKLLEKDSNKRIDIYDDSFEDWYSDEL